ncbi:hypothetical protein CBR_g41397 [Chara braunii]|uniref:Uncharacterized protein n=1 Tax=Chara braunii TaxID=69332 RepID=A0A388LVW6_CHABU|nr:hypothetical protein CBR_g41397 [Chara braunii]|eukprot:GBG86401.1 hypothetical protein CBR_g41397 [Chara braunii]
MNREMNSKTDRVCEAVSAKKGGNSDEVARLKVQLKELQRSLNESYIAGASARSNDGEEVVRHKAEVAELTKRVRGPMTSTSTKRTNEGEELAGLRSEQADMKSTPDRRFAALEDVIASLKGRCEEAKASAEARFRPRNTPIESPETGRRVDVELKGIVERHRADVDLLKEMRLKEVNVRKESKREVGRLKEALARLEMEKQAKVQDFTFKARLDKVAGPSARKDKGKVAATPEGKINEKEAFIRDTRR